MSRILLALGLQKESKLHKFFRLTRKKYRRALKVIKKKKLAQKFFMGLIALTFLATAILPYIL